MMMIAPRSSMMASASRNTLRGRGAPAEQRQHAQRERDVRRRGNGPAVQRRRIGDIDEHIDQRRQDHAAQRRNRRQGRLLARRQLADQQLALDLEADQEEENRHQPVVDPQQQRLVERELAKPEPEPRLQQRFRRPREARIVE